jgi:hypothetical protein
MNKLLKVALLATCLAYTSLPAGAQARDTADCCHAIEDALKTVSEIKAGNNRASIENNFSLDGGIQTRGKSRYFYKKCKLIKIDVEFSQDGKLAWDDLCPTDTVVRVSKPYLQYPITD